jgi:hypothetical protein
MNSRNKGKVGEREFASLLREHGYDARRGQQFSGGADSPDVVSDALAWLHFEIKRVQNLNLADACAQAEGDAGGKPWVVAHRRNHAPWLITMRAEFFFELIREFQPQKNAKNTEDGMNEGMENIQHSTFNAQRRMGGSRDGADGTDGNFSARAPKTKNPMF